MVIKKIYSRAERIRRGEYPNKNLRVTGNPGETIREVWIEFTKRGGQRTNPKEYMQRTSPIKYKLKLIYNSVINYFKEKLNLGDKIDLRDELIKGLESKF